MLIYLFTGFVIWSKSNLAGRRFLNIQLLQKKFLEIKNRIVKFFFFNQNYSREFGKITNYPWSIEFRERSLDF